MAVSVTTYKGGRMTAARPVGLLVGEHPHGAGTLPVHCGHFVNVSAFDSAVSSSARARRRSATKQLVKADRKGFHTFRCGDVVQSTEAASLGVQAVVFGVVSAEIHSMSATHPLRARQGAHFEV
eukprot:6186667-Pleurochrysis_carterae.AAC.2